jgi:CRP-like cAMP-binding protein
MVGAGFVIQEEHAYASAFIVIVSGDATVAVGRRTLGTLRSGQYTGAVGLLDHRRNLMAVTAATSVAVLVFSRSEYRSLLELVPRVATAIMPDDARHGRVAHSTPAAGRLAPGTRRDAPHPTLTPSRR